MEYKFNRFAAFADLTPAEMSALSSLADQTINVARGRNLREEGSPVSGIFVLKEGWAVTSASFAQGRTQILKLHLPGDVMGAPSLSLEQAAETITAATDIVVGIVPATKLKTIFAELPRLAMLFFLAAQEERVILMDRLMSLGCFSAKESLAALLVHLHDRLLTFDREGLPTFELPLTQAQIGEVLGISVVHANRVLRALEREKLIRRNGRWIALENYEHLKRLSGLPVRRRVRNPEWLPKPDA